MEQIAFMEHEKEIEPALVIDEDHLYCPFCGQRELQWDRRLREWHCEKCDSLVLLSAFFI